VVPIKPQKPVPGVHRDPFLSGWDPHEVTLRLREGHLHLGARRAGFRVFLVVGLSSSRELTKTQCTLIPRQGRMRVRLLEPGFPPVRKQTWFTLPPGPARLFLHPAEPGAAGIKPAMLAIEQPPAPFPEPPEPEP